MQTYLNLLRHVMQHGVRRMDRTGTGTLSVFGHQMRFPLSEGFPLVTTKKVFFKGFVHEMLWFLSGDTNIRYLKEHGVNIWNEWADEEGNLGPVYGRQWRAWKTADGTEIDQLSMVLQSLKQNPDSRRHIVQSWNVGELDKMALPPCHMFYQFYVAENRLSCSLYVRSNDLFLGCPFNIAQYALLTHMVAQQCDLDVGDLIYTIGDAHIYLNHVEQVEMQLKRDPFPSPRLRILRRPDTLFDYRYEDFELVNYQYHPAIKAPVAV